MREVATASDWCQRWDRGGHSWRHRSEGGFDPDAYTVTPIAEAAAKAYILGNHYSASYPVALRRYGLFTAGRLVGVCVLGAPVADSVLTNVFPDLVPHREAMELSRLVLADAVPANGESWFVSRCFEQAAATGVRGVVSFADPVPRQVAGRVVFPGHIGIIYQALNAAYCGRGTARSLMLLPDGRVLNDRARQKIRKQERGHEHVERILVGFGARPMRAFEKPSVWLAAAQDQVGVARVRHGGNHRYVFRLGNKAERRQVRIALPAGIYPKERDAA